MTRKSVAPRDDSGILNVGFYFSSLVLSEAVVLQSLHSRLTWFLPTSYQ